MFNINDGLGDLFFLLHLVKRSKVRIMAPEGMIKRVNIKLGGICFSAFLGVRIIAGFEITYQGEFFNIPMFFSNTDHERK